MDNYACAFRGNESVADWLTDCIPFGNVYGKQKRSQNKKKKWNSWKQLSGKQKPSQKLAAVHRME